MDEQEFVDLLDSSLKKRRFEVTENFKAGEMALVDIKRFKISNYHKKLPRRLKAAFKIKLGVGVLLGLYITHKYEGFEATKVFHFCWGRDYAQCGSVFQIAIFGFDLIDFFYKPDQKAYANS